MVGPGEKRVALVIGNAVYKHADTLRNPANDARAIGAALTRLGFTGARPRLNLDQNALRRALQDFAKRADSADMAVIYFAGHGVEVDMRNFLIPVDAKLERSRDVEFEAVALDQVLSSVDGARQLRLIILDACRNNPFRARMLRERGSRSIGQGLRSIEPGGNVLVAYAAKHGTFALDGKGDNSPFAEALLGHIERPGVEIVQLFREVRDDVLQRTGGEQEPHLYGSLGREGIYLRRPAVQLHSPTYEKVDNSYEFSADHGKFILKHPVLLAVFSGVAASALAIVAALLMQTSSLQCSSTDWDRVANSPSLKALRRFAVHCEKTVYGLLAEEELERRDRADWKQTRNTATAESYQAYLGRWENQKPYQGKYVSEAKVALEGTGFPSLTTDDSQLTKIDKEEPSSAINPLEKSNAVDNSEGQIIASDVWGIAASTIILDIRSPTVFKDQGILVSIKGLPNDANMSRGIDVGGGQWLTVPGALRNLTITSNTSGEFIAEAQLLTDDAKTALSNAVTFKLTILRSMPPLPEKAERSILLNEPPPTGDFLTQMLIRDGNRLMRDGDIVAARSLYEQAAAYGNAEAALAMGRSFDPSYFERLPVKTGKPDPATAFEWYKKASDGGLTTGRVETDALKDWMRR